MHQGNLLGWVDQWVLLAYAILLSRVFAISV
jgi:hypothetical protein